MRGVDSINYSIMYRLMFETFHKLSSLVKNQPNAWEKTSTEDL